MKELHMFAGVGGGILGGLLLGHTTIGAVEIELYCQDVLRQRQADNILPNFPIFGDIKEFNGYKFTEKYGKPDIICGGFPCQDISSAGKGAGISGERSGLWSEMARIISEIRPDYVFVENSPMLVGRGLTRVLADLTSMRYDAIWRIVGADDVGAPHVRKRIWILARRQDVANTMCLRLEPRTRKKLEADKEERASCSVELNNCDKHVADIVSFGLGTRGQPQRHAEEVTEPADAPCDGYRKTGPSPIDSRAPGWWGELEPDVVRMVYGVPRRVDRIKALGNAQVPAVAAFAFSHIMNMYDQLDLR